MRIAAPSDGLEFTSEDLRRTRLIRTSVSGLGPLVTSAPETRNEPAFVECYIFFPRIILAPVSTIRYANGPYGARFQRY